MNIKKVTETHNRWLGMTSYPHTISNGLCVGVDGKIYMALGIVDGGYQPYIYCYDPKTKLWASKNGTGATSRNHVVGGAVGRKIYVMTGNKDTTTRYNLNECYDIDTDSWSTKTVCPITAYGCWSVTLGTKIYLGGGYTGTYNYNFYYYDTVANAWTTLTSAPNVTHYASAAVCNNKIYVFGRHQGSVGNGYLVYDILSNTWSSLKTMPFNTCAGQAISINNKIYYFCGYNGTAVTRDAYCFEPDSQKWTQLATGTTAGGEGPSAAAIDGKIYIVGGYIGGYLTAAGCFDAENVPVTIISSPLVTSSHTPMKAQYPSNRPRRAIYPIHG